VFLVAGTTYELMRIALGSDPLPAIMSHRPLALSFTLLAVIAACSQMPSRPMDSGTPGARHVEAAAFTSGKEYSDVQVLTSLAPQHISAAMPKLGSKQIWQRACA
jgi:hypothetical protein